MTSIIYAALMGLLWIVNLFNGTGLDAVYHVTDYAKNIVIILTIIYFLFGTEGREKFFIERKDLFSFGLMIVSFLGSSFIKGYGVRAINYLWVFGLVYLISHLQLDENTFLWTGIMYGIGGLFILYIYDYGTVLHGWNENSIAMIGMHSFLMMIIPLFNIKSWISKITLIFVTLGYISLILPTDSRSGILFMIVGALFAINFLPRKIIYGGNQRINFFLAIPLIVAIVVVIIAGTSYFNTLNIWSYQYFRKPIFNGRDSIWQHGFKILSRHLLLGIGVLDFNSWHNSAINCLTAFGCIGYVFWISSFRNILRQAFEWKNDYLVQGCIISFIVLYMQQSVELGFIASNPSIIAYVILGMMLGRIRYLWINEVYNIAED